MKKTLTLLFLLVFALSSSGLLFSQNGDDEKFDKALEKYLDALWKFYPTAATVAGFHKYDKELEDMDKGDIEKRHTELDELNQEFITKVNKMEMSPDKQYEHEIILNFIDLELMRHEMLVPWSYNPLFYNEIIANCVRSVLTNGSGNAEEDAKNAAERLKNLPKLLKQAKENLETPPQIYTETAIRQFAGILDFYKTQLPALIDQASASQKSKLQENLTKALPELDAYAAYMSNELLPKSTGNDRLAGAQTRMLRATMMNDLPIQELVARADAEENNIRGEMVLICAAFYKIMDPEFDLNNPPASLADRDQYINVIVSHVMERFKKNHISKDDFFQALQSTAAEIKSFLQEKDLVDLPDHELKYAEMPAEAQGYTWLKLVAPPPYQTSGDYTLQVAPFAEDLGEEQIESLLEEYNNSFFPFYVSRKVYPGTFVPTYTLNQNSTLLTRLFPNFLLVKAWPILLEETMVKTGMNNYDLRQYLYQLKYRLKTVIDFKLDLNIHQAAMQKDQAIAYMTRKGFMTDTEAERNWNRMIMNPGDSVYIYAGLQEILDMEKAYKTKMGDAYSQKEFLAKLLSYGPIPMRLLKQKISQ